MSMKLKPLHKQAMVITGASSGIGLATAEAAARRGVKLVLVARSEEALHEITHRINSTGGVAIAVPCDVADRAQVERVAEEAMREFYRIDTWVNNAGLGMYGRLDEIDEIDARRLFDVNFWGVVNGSQAALPYLKLEGGALINVGSEVVDACAPFLGMYNATKQAVKGYTCALRAEVQDVDKAPVSVTLIQPTAVDTPFPQHSRNYTPSEPKLSSSMIDPDRVAEAILDAAVVPTREKTVGGNAFLNALVWKLIPRAGKSSNGHLEGISSTEAPRNPNGALHEPSESTEFVGHTHGACHKGS